MLALNIFSRITHQLGFVFQDTENHCDQIQVLVESGRAKSSMIQAARVFLGDFFCDLTQRRLVGVFFLHPIGEGLPLKFVLTQGGFAAVGAIC